jgi:ribonuclease HI
MKVYTDGSSSANGKKNCLSGCGVYFPETQQKLSVNSQEASRICGVELKGHSNNVGELLAILLAMTTVTDKTCELVIHSDSMYCINSLTVWYKSWKKNNWITAGGTPVKNKEIIQKILEEKEKFQFVFFKHVKAHRVEPLVTSREWEDWHGNDTADSLATNSLI